VSLARQRGRVCRKRVAVVVSLLPLPALFSRFLRIEGEAKMSNNGQPLSAILIFVFITFILPGIVLWIDEYLFVDELEKEEKESGKGAHLGPI
jgi:hypothetical protein